ncbi:oxalate decarboxylase OxdC-like [Latimeria chalumnae]|uniref:oxalate decarboxylase OxdC-like n=1 Tax=Latimeria chalumnae TaxID=7897 RepID=UPI00313E90D3
MENAAFEMEEDGHPSTRTTAKEPPKMEKQQETNSALKTNRCSLMRIFLVCLLASIIATAIGILLTFSYVTKVNPLKEPKTTTITSPSGKKMAIKYKYMRHLDKSKVYEFQGGAIQWARYRKNEKDYMTNEEIEFGSSINTHRSKMTIGSLRIKPKGLRVPHWHFNANEHGYLLQGSAWIGIVEAGAKTVVTYNVTAGQVIFLPKSTIHWVKNVGENDCVFVLFFTTHEELLTLDVDDAFYSTPEDIAARSLKPQDGVQFIRTFKVPKENQAINLPPNLAQLIRNVSYPQSVGKLVWKYFYDLPASRQFNLPGGAIQWARYRKDGTGLTENEKVYSDSLYQNEDTITLATLRIYSNGLRQPHFHFNAHEMGYVISGCAKVGIIDTKVSDFEINVGDVIFFPVGTQHYVKSTCDEDLLLILAFSTAGKELKTLDMDDYFRAVADHILAQLFLKKQEEFNKIPTLTEDQAINLP